MWDRFIKTTRKRGKLFIILVVVITIISSIADISVKTNTIPISSPTLMQSNLNTLIGTNTPHYNFRIGYINFTTGSKEITFGYFLRPFNGLNPVYAGPINYSRSDVSNNLVNIGFYQISPQGSSGSHSIPFSVSGVTLTSPQGLGKVKSWELHSSNVFSIYVNDPAQFFESFSATYTLGQYPGYHNFYLNFTFTIYNTFGPYKFAAQSRNVHLEYNNTIID